MQLDNSRQSPWDLEIGGELAGLPPGTTRFLSREALLTLPQVTFTVSDDANFTGPTKITGILLENLTRTLSASPASALVVAICDDQYRVNYPQQYVASHHPVLVLEINDQPPSGWPKDSEGHGMSMGPFLISHTRFIPSFKVLSHSDEQQIPWGVIRLEFRNENTVFGAIAPRGPHAQEKLVQSGFKIARQNCFRCHNMGSEGGTKAGQAWPVLAAWAGATPDVFSAYIHNPQTKNPEARMPGFPAYDQQTLRALTAYFRTFLSPPGERP